MHSDDNLTGSVIQFQNALIVDGSGQPAYLGDLCVQAGRIVSLHPKREISHQGSFTPDAHRIDCSGLVLSPGFIDVHTHDDAAVLDTPLMLPKVSQGVTTVIVGNCGISLPPLVTQEPRPPLSLLGKRQFRHATFEHYVQAIQSQAPSVNVGALIGHTTLRMRHMSNLDRPATPEERTAMSRSLNDAMLSGALGLSSGVFYREAYAADVVELVTLAKVAARHGGVYATHIRDESDQVIPALREAAEHAMQAGLPLIISHHKCAGPRNWGRTRQSTALLTELSLRQDIAMDVYPYTAGSTVLRTDLVESGVPIMITGSDSYPQMIGRYLSDIAHDWGVSEREACERLIPGGACYFQMHQDDVDRVVRHDLSMIGSDGLPHDERPHPRLWGTFPRVLAHYWRDLGMLSLEQAIYKMTGLSARHFRIPNRGRIAEGFCADLVLFNPKQIRDLSTFEEPTRASVGIEQVWVNGVLTYAAPLGTTGARAGQLIRAGSPSGA